MSNITPPTTLDKLEDSLDTHFKDVFISYGRAESKAFATKLCEQLTEKGYKVWFDQNDIPLGVDFQHQIDEGIETAHNFIFVIAPHAVKSPYCRKEIELAVKRGKRIIPLLHIEPTEKEVWDMMHPAISKINWVYMRQKWEKEKEQIDYETIDDFDTGLKGVLSLLEQEKEYVQRHTQILFRAIEWERNHHNSMFLLVANERQQAEEWLFNRFESSQPPCFPSDLHVRFISEAKKNANNLQTDVFIASAEKEKEGNSMTREQIIYMLALYGYTSWSHVNDLNSGIDFHKAIKKGVEGADNLIFLITKESLESEYCMEELEYAISLNKRIIPLRLEKIEESEFPAILKDIQYIDFANNVENISLSKNEKTDFEKDIDELLKILDTDKEYIQRHKILLTQALKWYNQEKNPSMLLRGHNLEQAKIWLKIGQKRETNIPLAIHEDFIKESQAKSSSERTDVFVSYSRTDGDIARKLNENLQIAGKTTWFDQESIASGADFQKEIYQGIQNADNIIFILSAESILSPYCADEVEFAQKLGKRFITLLYREINTDELHGALSAVQWIDFRTNTTKFDKQFAEVLRTLDTDREHVQAHTKWQNEAMEWISFDKNSDFLLRGNELLLANNWLKEAKEFKKIPLITDLQDEFIKESLKQQNKVNLAIERNKQIAIATVAIIFAIAMLAGSQWYKSFENQKELAIKNLIFESKDLINQYPDEAIVLAYEAYKASEKKSLLVIKNLYHHLQSENKQDKITNEYNPLIVELKAEDSILAVMAATNKSRFVTIDKNRILYLFDTTGFIKELDGTLVEYNNDYYNRTNEFDILLPTCLAISPNGKRIVAKLLTPQNQIEIILFDENGNKLKSIETGNNLNDDSFTHAFSFEKFNQTKDSTYLVISRSFPDTLTKIYTDNGEFLDTLKENGFVQLNQKGLKSKIENKIWNKSVGRKIKNQALVKSEVVFYLGMYKMQKNDNDWQLLKGDSIIETYTFPKNVSFSTLQSEDYLVVYDYHDASIFKFSDKVKPLFKDIETLSSEEKINYQTATLDDYRQVPKELSQVIAKGLLFLTVFLLSLLVLNYMNMLVINQKYFKAVMYLFVGFAVGLGWFILIMNEEQVIQVAFCSSTSLSVMGFIFGVKDFKKQFYFNGTLYLVTALLLFIGSSAIFYYVTKADGLLLGTSSLFGWITWLLLGIVAITHLAIEKAENQFIQRNFIYFSDWIGLIIFIIITYLAITISLLDFQNITIQILAFLVLPLTYFSRTLIHHYVLYVYQKAPYSLSVLKSYILTPIFLILIGIGFIINIDNVGENYVLRYSFVGFLFYSLALYSYTIFVAFKQKDKINLRANFFFWWTIMILIFSIPILSLSIVNNYVVILLGSIWILPLIWWANKYRKNVNLEKLKANQVV